MKKTTIVSVLFCLLAASCNYLGSGKISVSENTFHLDQTGGEITFTTSGFVKCEFRVSDNPLYTGNLRLNLDGPIEYSAEWFSVSFDKNGKRVSVLVHENTSTQERTLTLLLDNLDMHGRVSIHQKGQ